MIVRIGHLSTFYHTALLLMARTDIADSLGADPMWRLFGSGPAIMQAFSRDELDLAYIGLPPAIIGIGQGTPVICVAGGHMEGTIMAGKSRWKSLAQSYGLRDVLQQFIGGKIGVSGRGSIHDVILRECLDREGLMNAVEVVNFPWADLITEAVVSDEVHAAVGTPALAVAVMRFAGGSVLVSAQDLWPSNPSYGIVVDRGFLRRNRAIVERFLITHEEASASLRSDPEGAAETIAAHVGIIDRDFVLDTLNISPRYCAQLTDEYIASTMRFIPVLRRLGYLSRNIAEDEVFDRTLIRSVHPGKDHYSAGISAP